MTSHAVSDEALDIIFRDARTQNKWHGQAGLERPSDGGL